MKMVDRTGQRFGRLTVVHLSGRAPVRWLCRCDCGKEHEVSSDQMHKATGCGCKRFGPKRRDMSLFSANGESYPPTPEYKSWKHMMGRCFMETHESYANYGGRGITVCERWRSYPNFLADMGRKPTPGHTIEREDNNVGYEPGNCRWATKAEQNRNQRSTIFVEVDGRRLCLAAASRASGVSYSTVCGRVKRGWSIEQALSTVPRRRTHAESPR